MTPERGSHDVSAAGTSTAGQATERTLPVPPAITPEPTLSPGPGGLLSFLRSAVALFGGLILMVIVLGLALRHQVTTANPEGVGLVSWYWHFVDVVWVVVFSVVYLLGR